MIKRDGARLLKTLVLGGPLIMLMFLSIVFMGVALTDYPEWSLQHAITAFAVFAASLFGVVRVTGFWGRWPMVAFIAAAPLVVVLDFAINPLFPVGAILFGVFCLAAFNGKLK